MSTYERVRENLVRYRKEKAESNIKEVTPSTVSQNKDEGETDGRIGGSPPPTIDVSTEPALTAEPTDSLQDTFRNPRNESDIPTTSSWTLFILKLILWCILQVLFIELQFGVVFFVCSCLFFMVYSMIGSRRDPNQLSAYSIFNKNFERIEGTLTAEQFEKEIRHGPATVH